MILIDTSVLIGSLTGERVTFATFQKVYERGEVLVLASMVLFEWLRGPRVFNELVNQEKLFPSIAAIPFGPSEAVIASDLYRKLPRARGREMDIAIAACAIARDIPLWTLNRDDFADIPGLKLASIH